MALTYPLAAALVQITHCSGCGMTDPTGDAEEEYSSCCSKRICIPSDELREEPCCEVVASRLEAEAREGGPAGGRSSRTSRKGGGRKGRTKRPAPVEDAPAEDAPAEDTPVEDAPAEDAPAEETPVEDTPVEDTPAEDAPAEETPVEDTPVEDAPAEDAPAEEKGAKKKGGPGRRTFRAALGPSSAEGWELLYDKPKDNCEIGRRDGKYALICKDHKFVHPLPRLTAERTIRPHGGWCPECPPRNGA